MAVDRAWGLGLGASPSVPRILDGLERLLMNGLAVEAVYGALTAPLAMVYDVIEEWTSYRPKISNVYVKGLIGDDRCHNPLFSGYFRSLPRCFPAVVKREKSIYTCL